VDKMNSDQTNDFRRYYPPRHELKKMNGFDFFISADESVIYKKNNFSNPKFHEMVNTKEKRAIFSKILDCSVLSDELKPHVCIGYDLEEDGSYKSEFIHGFRLDLLKDYSLDASAVAAIKEQCTVLLSQMAVVNSKNQLIGDWALHNLVFSLKYKRIINIDLEGFLFYDPLPEWADYDTIEGWLSNIEIAS